MPEERPMRQRGERIPSVWSWEKTLKKLNNYWKQAKNREDLLDLRLVQFAALAVKNFRSQL
jgi:hypothetical protein